LELYSNSTFKFLPTAVAARRSVASVTEGSRMFPLTLEGLDKAMRELVR